MSGTSKENVGNSQELKVTVVIPCHNHADMIGDAIDSVTSQDYRPINIIVIDDGSEDNPEKVVDEKSQANSSDQNISISCIRNEKAQGPSAARNKAIEHMWNDSDVFMMLDADDRYLDKKISKSVSKYVKNKKHIGIVYTDAIIININTGTKIHELREPYSRARIEQECIISNTPLISKDALSLTGGYDEGMRTCEDWDLWLRITESFIAVHIPEPLHIYSVTGKNSSDVVDKSIWNENWAKIRERINQRKNESRSKKRNIN
jgi:glycosyltransferase involved in cell wall biosynthesis